MIVKDLKMYAIEGGLTRLAFDVKGDRTLIAKECHKVKECECELKIIKLKSSRSLDANSKYQVSLDELASLIGTSRDELHEEMLQRYGVTKRDNEGNPILFPLPLGVDGHSVAPHCEAVKKAKANGKDVMWWRVIKGSSEMNTEEFAHLLDGLLSEIKECT